MRKSSFVVGVSEKQDIVLVNVIKNIEVSFLTVYNVHSCTSIYAVCMFTVSKHTTYGDVGIATLKAQQNMFKY